MPKPLCPEQPAKRWFPSRIEAQKFATSIEYEHGYKLRAYQCPACLGWHLTSQEAA